MLQRLSIVFVIFWLSTGFSSARADLLVVGSDSSKSTALADMVNKNADVRNAVAAFDRGDLQECERLFSQAIKVDKNLPSVDIMIARLLMSKGKFNEALTRLESYMMRGSSDPEAHATMGEIALLSGRFTDAWLQFREALSIVTTSSTLNKARKEAFTLKLLQLRAETAERRNDFDSAQTLYKELEKLIPESGFPLMAQARILIANGDMTRGVELLRRARKLDDKVPQPELQIALALANGKDAVETEKWFQDGIRQADSVTVANWFEYLKWLLTQDRPRDVQVLVQRAPPKFQSNRLLKFLNGMAFRYLGKVDEAEKIFSELLSDDVADLEAADQLALILVESADQGKKIRAQQLSQNNLRRAGNEESAIATAAWVEFKLGAVDVADQYFNTLVSRGTRSPQTIYYIARILETRGREEEAKALFQTAVELPGLFVQRLEVAERFGIKRIPNEVAKDEKGKGLLAPTNAKDDSKNSKESSPKGSKKEEGKGKEEGKSTVAPSKDVKSPDAASKTNPKDTRTTPLTPPVNQPGKKSGAGPSTEKAK